MINKIKSVYQIGICTLMFISASFTKAKIQKYPKCPSTGEWIKDVTHTHRRILFYEKEENNMEELKACDVKSSQRKTNTLMSLTCGKVKLMEIESRMVVTRSWGMWEMGR